MSNPASPLPARPSLEQLRKQAKELLKAYRADDRAISSVNREIFAQQQQLATRIRSIKPQVVLALPGEAEETEESEYDDDALASAGAVPVPGRLRRVE